MKYLKKIVHNTQRWWGLDWLWCLMPLSTTFTVYIVAVSFIGGGNHQSVASQWQTLSFNVVSSTPYHERVVSSTPCHEQVVSSTPCHERGSNSPTQRWSSSLGSIKNAGYYGKYIIVNIQFVISLAEVICMFAFINKC